ncbi:MAG: phage head closure protein, partial [Staphylococcus simulans]|nr:phage head closure protein [Staphylococcus simulans]
NSNIERGVCSVEIGRLKHRIRIYSVESVRNDEGGYTEQEQTVARPFCEVSKTTIKEFKEMGLDQRKDTIDFIMRYQQRVNIESDMMIDFNNKKYKIKFVEHDLQDKDRLMLKCEVVE